MRLGVVLATLTGLSAMIALLVHNDAVAIFSLVASIGWGLVFVVLVRACILAVAGIA
jgi:hypothetical protein